MRGNKEGEGNSHSICHKNTREREMRQLYSFTAAIIAIDYSGTLSLNLNININK